MIPQLCAGISNKLFRLDSVVGSQWWRGGGETKTTTGVVPVVEPAGSSPFSAKLVLEIAGA